MKKLNYLFLILFVIDLIILLGYGQAQEETRATYTYYRVGFYWYYFFPAAYFFGGYLLGQLLLCRSRISLHPIAEKILFTLISVCLIVYLVPAILSTVHIFTTFLPFDIAAQLHYFIMSIFTKALFLFSVLGLTLFVCLSSRKSRKESLSDSTL